MLKQHNKKVFKDSTIEYYNSVLHNAFIENKVTKPCII